MTKKFMFINVNDYKNIDDFLTYLYNQKIVHLLIEGGNKTLMVFQDYFNEFVQYITPIYYDINNKDYLTFNLTNLFKNKTKQ